MNRLLSDCIEEINTPALVYDESRLETLLACGLAARERAGIKLLYAVKALSLLDVLSVLAPHLDGFAVSSLFEARFINNHFPGIGIHFTSPGIRQGEVSELGSLVGFVSANSIPQAYRYGSDFSETSSLGIRVNTGVSCVKDHRYNPCRPNSKLGIPIDQVSALLTSAPFAIEGLHIHTNADSTDYDELLDNVRVLANEIPKGHGLKWVNLGGGYLLEDVPLDPLTKASALLKDRFGVEVFIEPGAGLVRAAGFLIGSVLDTFDVDGRHIAVLDVTVNHMPEVLEFDYQPDVIGHQEDGQHEYILAGATCLAGDVFGTYGFSAPLEPQDKVIFEDAGAYTLAKAHRFKRSQLA